MFPSVVAQLMLSMLGLKSNETGRVSEEELRLIVTGAKMSGGIESQEGMMIEGVLDLQVIMILLVQVLSPCRSINQGVVVADGSQPDRVRATC